MASQSRKARGMRSQLVAARWFQTHGFPWAESTGAGRSGSDITNMPGLAPEVKARSDLQPLAWLKQAEANAGLPFVIFRPNGMGEESIGLWGVMVRLEVFTELLRAAGFGSPEDVAEQNPQTTKDAEGEGSHKGSHGDDLKNDEAPLAEGHPSALLDPQHARKAT